MTTDLALTRTKQTGSVSIMVLIWAAITSACVFAVMNTGEKLATRQHLQHGADAVALAWVSRGADTAQLLAQIYGIAITAVDTSNNRVRVWVQQGDHNGSATAQYTQ